jgi:hypothetical protein
MKKIFTKHFLPLVFLLVLSGIASAQQLLSHDFSYSGNLTSNGWTAHSAGGTTPIATTTGLSYTSLQGSGIGNAALVNNIGGEDINFGFANQTVSGQNIYISALVNVTDPAATKTGDYFLHLGNTAGAGFANFNVRLFARITATGVNFGISKNNGTGTYGTTNFSKNTT